MAPIWVLIVQLATSEYVFLDVATQVECEIKAAEINAGKTGVTVVGPGGKIKLDIHRAVRCIPHSELTYLIGAPGA